MSGFVKDLKLACACGGKFMGTGDYKTVSPMFTGCKCDKCGTRGQAYLDSDGNHHLERHEAIAADRAKLGAITHCTCCGNPVDGANCATSCADVKVCRTCFIAARAANMTIRDVSRNPALIGVATS